MTNTIDLKKTITTLTITILLISTIAFITIQPASPAGGKVVTYYPSLVKTGTSTAEWATWATEELPEVVLTAQGSATAAWTTEKHKFGLYSVELTTPGDWDNAIVKVYYGLPLTDIENDDIKYWYYTEVTDVNSWSVLYLDTDDNGIVDVLLWGKRQAVETRGAWTETTPWAHSAGGGWTIKTDLDEDGSFTHYEEWNSLAKWKDGTATTESGVGALADAELVYVGVHWGTGLAGSRAIYIDDFTIDGVTYSLEEPLVKSDLYGAKLYTTYKTGDYAAVEIIPTTAVTIDDISDITDGWSFSYYMVPGSYYGPLLELHFTSTTGSGHVDITVDTAESVFNLGVWTEEPVTSSLHALLFGNLDDGTPISNADPGDTLANLEAWLLTEHSITDWVLTRVQVQLGYAAVGEATDTSTAYIDDITIAGVTEDFEPRIALDYEWYKMDDVVKLTVFDIGLNTRSTIKDSGTFIAASDYPDQITVDLLETGPYTSVFEGTFTVVEEEPGANDLLVEHGSKIDISYMDATDSLECTADADVDAEAPTVTGLLPVENANITDTTPTIGATVGAGILPDSGLEIAWMSLDGAPCATRGTYDELTFTVPEPIAEGDHTVQVTAKDVAGNINVTSWSFNIDVTEPTCVINMNATKPAVNATDAIKFTFKFSQDMKTAPTIAGNITDYMDSKTVPKPWIDLRTYIANYTVKADLDFNGTVIITAAGAKDVAGNVMVPANFTFYIDTIAPTAPENLTATAQPHSVVLGWDASEDVGSGVELYNIYRNDTKVDSVDHPTTTFTDAVLEAGTWNYTVGAVDFAGNEENSTDVTVEFEPAAVTEFDIALSEGWNLVSLPLVPSNPDIEVVLADVMVEVEIVWSYDNGTWSRYLPAAPEFSTLTEMVDGKGYWINMTADATLTVYGTELPVPPKVPPTYHVYQGWNLIGFKSTENMNVSRYLTTIPDELKESMVIYGWDATTQSYELVCVGTPTVGVEKFTPGQGYWLYITGEADIVPPLPS